MITIGMLGGMTGPTVDADAMHGGREIRRIPRFTIPGISSVPVAARSAAALPLMPAMMTLARSRPAPGRP